MSQRPRWREMPRALLALSACAVLCACNERPRSLPPRIVGSFSVGPTMVLADAASDHLLRFELLGAVAATEMGYYGDFRGTVLAVRCVNARDEVLENGECGDQGATLIACMQTAADRFELQSQQLDQPGSFQRLVLNMDCSRMRVVDRYTVVLADPELFSSGVASFGQVPSAAFASVVQLREGVALETPLVPASPAPDQKSEDVGAGPSPIARAAPVGAESDALRRIEVFPGYVVLVFNSYIGVAAIASQVGPTPAPEQLGRYHIVDLFEPDLADPVAPSDPDGSSAQPLVAVADGA